MPGNLLSVGVFGAVFWFEFHFQLDEQREALVWDAINVVGMPYLSHLLLLRCNDFGCVNMFAFV